MAFGIQHVQHDSFVIVMSEAREASAKFLDLLTSGVDVIDLHIQVDPDLSRFRFGYTLEGESRKRP